MTFIPKDQIEEFLTKQESQDVIEKTEGPKNQPEETSIYQGNNNQRNNQRPEPDLTDYTDKQSEDLRTCMPVIAVLLAFAGFIYWAEGRKIERNKKEENSLQEYKYLYMNASNLHAKALVLHADTNFDHNISEKEKNDFNQKMCGRNNVTIIDGKFIQNSTGLELTIEEQIKILEQYQN
ncbi:hypothetical protein HZA97_01550 [Candidatus Woesearchaeota archaeon]|nr:hypothetical protein [Candidatus Woesearchaeota archaeon]